MPKFFRGGVPAWFRGDGAAARGRRAARRKTNAVARAAAAACEPLEERKLFAVATLTNGNGDATLDIIVDSYGAYGSAAGPAGEATYDPIGPIGPEGTTFESAVFFSPTDEFLSESGIEGPGLPGVAFTATTPNSVTSTFNRGGFTFNLTQTVGQIFDQGTTFTQTYRVTNTLNTNQTVRFVRHVDGDLDFEPGLNDFAGVSADGEFVFEFDTAIDPTQATGFFGISATGGTNSSYTVQQFRYSDNIDAANAIPGGDVDEINGDANNDRLTDTGYDVTISLQTDFTIPAGATVTYTTITRFGQGAPADIIGTPQVGFAVDSFVRSENGRFATIVVTRQGARTGNSTVDYATVLGGSATPNVDYTPVTGTLTFPAGQNRATFTIPIIDDDILDGDETVLIRLSNPSNGTQLTAGLADATLTILDDTPFIQLAAPTYTVLENAGVAQISVLRTGSSEGEATVDYQVNSGTAVAGADFTPVSGSLFFANGQAEAFIQVPITLDFLLEPDETAEIIISNVAGSNMGSPTRAVLTIENFETPPAVLDVDTIGFNNRITGIVITYSTDLDPARAELHTNYDLYTRKEKPLGGAVSRTRIKTNNATFRYDAAADTVTISPLRGLKYNRFYELQINGARVNAIAAVGGTLLDGDQDTVPGNDYRTYIGRGNRLSYYDTQGDLVSLRTQNGGLMDIDRPVARNLANVELQDVFQLETVIAGTFLPAKQQSDQQSTIVLTNSFGVTRQLPPNIVVQTPDLEGL